MIRKRSVADTSVTFHSADIRKMSHSIPATDIKKAIQIRQSKDDEKDVLWTSFTVYSVTDIDMDDPWMYQGSPVTV